jgi:hypothetical protein
VELPLDRWWYSGGGVPGWVCGPCIQLVDSNAPDARLAEVEAARTQVTVRAAAAAAEGCAASAAWLRTHREGKVKITPNAPPRSQRGEGVWATAAAAVVGAPVELWEVRREATPITKRVSGFGDELTPPLRHARPIPLNNRVA